MRPLFLFFILAFTWVGLAQKPIFTDAKLHSATVYFNSAELSHQATVNLPKGTSEVVIKNISNFVNENSVRISAPKNVTVLSVQYTTNYISEYEIDQTSPLIKQVKDSINILQKEVKKIQNRKASESKVIELLDSNHQVYGENSGLNVTELSKMVDFYATKRNAILDNIDTLTEKEQKLNTQLKKLNARLQINSSNEEKTSNGKLILQIMSNSAQTANLEFSYLTYQASWNPFYELRAESISAPLELVYKGQVVQKTGIDWKNVKLTLSSGLPNQNNQFPILNAWFLKYLNPELIIVGYGAQLKGEVHGVVVQNSIQSFDKLGEVVTENEYSKNFAEIVENQLNVSFDIDIPYDILSNGKNHSISLKEINIPVKYKYYAAPRIDGESYLVAEISDYSQYNLLPAEANIIFEQMYVGKTYINPNQTTEELKLSMGRDKRISVKREKIADKSGTRFLSNYKEQTFTYDITLRNNKKESIEMIVKDQIPLSTDKDITIEILEISKAEHNKETGILTWDVKLKPSESQKFRISYKVRYPKDKVIENL